MLHEELPRWDGSDSAPRRLIQSLEKTIKKDRIQEILANVNQRTTVLQLSLATLSFGAQAGMQRSQEQMQQDIRGLTDKIRSLKPTWGASDASSATLETEASGSLYEEISDWKKTAHEMAVALSLKGEDGSFASSVGLVSPSIPYSLVATSNRTGETDRSTCRTHCRLPKRTISILNPNCLRVKASTY